MKTFSSCADKNKQVLFSLLLLTCKQFLLTCQQKELCQLVTVYTTIKSMFLPSLGLFLFSSPAMSNKTENQFEHLSCRSPGRQSQQLRSEVRKDVTALGQPKFITVGSPYCPPCYNSFSVGKAAWSSRMTCKIMPKSTKLVQTELARNECLQKQWKARKEE